MRKRLLGCVVLAIVTGVACSSDDPVVERRGGELPDPSGAGGKKGGDMGAAGAAGASDGENLIAYCDALVVLQNKCQRCHGNPRTNGAPVAFLGFEIFQDTYSPTSDVTWREAALDIVERDGMPYVALNDPPTSLMPAVEPLTVEEKATLVAWLEQGAKPQGGADCP